MPRHDSKLEHRLLMPTDTSLPPTPTPTPPPLAYPKDSIYFAWNDCLRQHTQKEDTLLLIQLWRQTGYNDALKAVEEFHHTKERARAASFAAAEQEQRRLRAWELFSGRVLFGEFKSTLERIKIQRYEKGNTQLRKWENRYRQEQRLLNREMETHRFWAAVIPYLIVGGLR